MLEENKKWGRRILLKDARKLLKQHGLEYTISAIRHWALTGRVHKFQVLRKFYVYENEILEICKYGLKE